MGLQDRNTLRLSQVSFFSLRTDNRSQLTGWFNWYGCLVLARGPEAGPRLVGKSSGVQEPQPEGARAQGDMKATDLRPPGSPGWHETLERPEQRAGSQACCILPRRQGPTSGWASPAGDHAVARVTQQDRDGGQPTLPRATQKAAQDFKGF